MKVTSNPTLWVLNGPNLNLLGTREPEVYGHVTLAEIEKLCADTAQQAGFGLEFRQSNQEGELVDWVQSAADAAAGLVINAGAYTHTSIALHDALRTVTGPLIEVHLTNIFAREEFRRHSYISPLAHGVICGLGPYGYVCSINALANIISDKG
ncbi:MAG: type II 3-dehydroquinate dehydratase [Alphaproteobacteria bacterium]|nr:type II 3-dehydroquinate dehydratase [Alphaproteobacteria bacterium]